MSLFPSPLPCTSHMLELNKSRPVLERQCQSWLDTAVDTHWLTGFAGVAALILLQQDESRVIALYAEHKVDLGR